MAKYEFAIKKDVLNSGRTFFTPVCRKRSRFGKLNILPNPWERITKIYNEFTIMELHFIPDLSYEECQEHIRGYQETLMQQTGHQIATVEFHTLEEKKI